MKRSWFWLLVVLAATAFADDAREAIIRLRAEIARHDDLYHRRAAPEISDADYDGLKRRLAELERTHPDAARSAPALPAIGDDRTGQFRTVRHEAPLLSLDKAYNDTQLAAFDARCRKTLGRDVLEYVVEPKYDGLAVSVVYERGKLIRAVTRGNGQEGDDITENVRAIRGLMRELSEERTGTTRLPERIEVRGEIYVPYAEFASVNEERHLAGQSLFANPRNLAAGTMRQTDPRIVAERGLRVVFFGVGACEPASALPATHREIQETLASWGLPTVRNVWHASGLNELRRAIAALGEMRGSLAFPTDGAVVKINDRALQRELAATDAAPRWAIAYKFPPERAETEVVAITVQVGRTGVLTPVAELAPVELAGSTISRVTLHNRQEIVRRDVRVGDYVYVEKAGDVIPSVVGVNLARRPSHAQPFSFPLVCPDCGSAVEMTTKEAAVRCGNASCPAQLRRRVEHFASKACMDIEGLGPAMIDRLVGEGLVKRLEDLYRLEKVALLALPRMGDKSVERLLGAIERSKSVELSRVIYGLGLPHVGLATAKEMAGKHGTLVAVAEAEPRTREQLLALAAVGVRPKASAPISSALAGKTFVLTGTLAGFTRAEATARIEEAGAKVGSTVTRATNYLVVGARPGSKLEQARKLGITVIDEKELCAMLELR